MKSIFRIFLTLVFVVKAQAQWVDGIYADFQTSLGDFTASLNYQQSPKAVANFIGLAEGSRAWIDPASGAVRVGQPFYNGVVFHRVIAGFMNQAGSKNGLGTDGPGYVFQDETSNGLGHGSPYTLSMANSGVNSNGSQFFITVAPTTWLDGVHTVFGSVVSGQSVIDAINAVPTGTNNKPLTDVVIQSVGIRRVGAAAVAFDIHVQWLPVCTGVAGNLDVDMGVECKYVLKGPMPPATTFSFYRSDDLISWAKGGEIYRSATNAPINNVVIDGATSAARFFNLAYASYPIAGQMGSNANRTLTVPWQGNQTLIFQFNSAGTGGTGSYNNNGSLTPFAFSVSSYSPDKFDCTWTFNTNFGGLGVVGKLDNMNPTTISGAHKVYQYQGTGWVQLGTGTYQLTR